MNKRLWFVPAMGTFLGILLLSTVFAAPFQIEGIGYVDKIEHAFAYFVLTVSMLLAFQKNEWLTPQLFWIILAGSVGYGMLLEWTQYTLFPDRYFEWMDALANLAGVMIGGVSFRLFVRG